MKREVDLANQPALVPLFGGTDKRPRPLDRDVITIGRARGCDVGLEAPEISTLHCVLYRTAEGFKVRDCGSRAGTRINGELPRQHVLADGDVLQIGPFSFAVKVPPSSRCEPGKPDKLRLERWGRSRRKLVQLALGLRKRLRKNVANGAADAELSHKATDLRNQIRHYDERLNQLESAERDLESEREQLRREREGQLAHAQKVEADLIKRLEAADQEIHAKWHEFGQRCAREETQLAERTKDAAQQRHKLDEQAAALLREKAELATEARHLNQSVADLRREREEFMHSKEQTAAEQAEAAVFDKQRTALSQAEAALREQRTELGRMMGELRELQSAIKKQQTGDVQSLTEENDELRRRLAASERHLADITDNASAPAPEGAANLQEENELLRQLLQEKEGTAEELRQQLESLKAQIQAKPEGLPENVDVDTFEAELLRDRQQLEVDRTKLNKEIEQLRARNAELDAATREMEMEMSKERAELARERMRLDRLRDEVRGEAERMQRDAGMRESLAPVNKLREEMNQKKASKEEGQRMADRIRSVRNRLSDAPS